MKRIDALVNKYKLSKMPWKSNSTCNIGFNPVIVNPQYISLGKHFSAEDNLRLQAWTEYKGQIFSPEIIIGDNVSMMESCQISCCNRITIGDGVLFGANVFVTDNFHGDNSIAQLDIPPIDRPLDVRGEVVIGNNVWVGRNVCIMPGVFIGDGAVIGANAVVTHDIPAYSVAAGVPAKVIKTIERFFKIDYNKLTKEDIEKHIDDLYMELKDPNQLDWMPKKG